MSDKKVFDFEAKRRESIEQKRRSFERVVFEEFLGVDAMIDDNGTGYPLKLIDISAEGCQFQMPYSAQAKNKFTTGAEVTLKLFFTKNSFLPTVIKVRRTAEFVDPQGNVHWRCGGEFDKSLPSFKALESFVQFIYKYAEFSCHDSAAHKVYFL